MDKKIQAGYEVGQWFGEICIGFIGILLIMIIFSLPLYIWGWKYESTAYRNISMYCNNMYDRLIHIWTNLYIIFFERDKMIEGRDLQTDSMAYKIANFLLANDEWTTGNVVVKLEDDGEYLCINRIRIDEENDIVIDVSYQ